MPTLTKVKIQRNTQQGYVVQRDDAPGWWYLPTLVGTPQNSLSRMTPYKGNPDVLESVPDYLLKLGLQYCGYSVADSAFSKSN